MEYPDTVKKLPSHVKYLQIMPEEAIIHADLLPVIPLSSLKIEKLENVTVQYYRFLYNQTGGPVRTLRDEAEPQNRPFTH